MLLVSAYHFAYFPVLSNIGWCGVDLFFVLSGYLISGLLFSEYSRTGTFNVGRFWLRRGLKIWPSLYVFLVAALPLAVSNGPGWGPSMLASAFFYSNYSQTIRLVGHTWSLAVEEHFYLALPLLLLLLIRLKRLPLVPWVGMALLAICMALRCAFPVNAWSGTQ